MEERLISLVENYSVLYDTCGKYYYDSVQREHAWEEIAAKLGEPVDVVKRKWTSLRDCFRKAIKNRKTRGGDKIKEIKPWKHEEQMSFILPYFSDKRQPKSNLSAGLNPTYSEETEIDIKDEYLGNQDDSLPAVQSPQEVRTIDQLPPPSFASLPASSAGDASPNTSRKGTHSETLPPMEQILKTYLDDRKRQPQPTSDHLTKFFAAMEETVRTLTPVLQIEVKAKISALVSEYELKNLEATSNSQSHHQMSQYSTQYQTFSSNVNARNPPEVRSQESEVVNPYLKQL